MSPNERTQFRHLTDDEVNAIVVISFRHNNYTMMRSLALIQVPTMVQYSHLGSGFTVCILRVGDQIKLGASRCSHLDRPNRIKGEMLALKRAVTSKAPPIYLSTKDEPDTVSSDFPLDFSYNPPQRIT